VPPAEVNGIAQRMRNAPSLLVVPLNGAVLDPEKLPILYAPPLPRAGRSQVVRKGDTLWGIARGYAVSVSDLKRRNDVRALRPGSAHRVERPWVRQIESLEKHKTKLKRITLIYLNQLVTTYI